ncbi:hypothetical protein TELCIR_24891 [Teladorsagia circumcincta]|uniref:Uncharacterized protein n=1 Tax=Teladorsagia circumcincta TaxID=45464 RepID=A0A2G9T723_TELCI|nr:hypothetical protein TELCIR_24891 [Teladorsagia circumcincta]
MWAETGQLNEADVMVGAEMISGKNSYNLYLLLLSLFDVFIGVSYIAVISNNVLINWTASYTLKAIW